MIATNGTNYGNIYNTQQAAKQPHIHSDGTQHSHGTGAGPMANSPFATGQFGAPRSVGAFSGQTFIGSQPIDSQLSSSNAIGGWGTTSAPSVFARSAVVPPEQHFHSFDRPDGSRITVTAGTSDPNNPDVQAKAAQIAANGGQAIGGDSRDPMTQAEENQAQELQQTRAAWNEQSSKTDEALASTAGILDPMSMGGSSMSMG